MESLLQYIITILFSLTQQQNMKKSINPICTKGFSAQKACNNQLCKQISIMCNNEDCDCHKPHEDCISTVLFSSLIKKLNIKGMGSLPLKESLIEWYHKQIKYFNILIEKTQKSIDDTELVRGGDDGKLYKLLKEKKYQQVTSDLVYRAVTNLIKQPKINIQGRMSELQQQMKKAAEEIEIVLEKLKIQKGKTQQHKISVVQNIPIENNISPPVNNNIHNNKFRFSESLNHGNIHLMQRRYVKMFINYNWRLSLLQPTLSLNPNSERTRVRFRMFYELKRPFTDVRYVSFGVCQLKEARTKRFQAIYQDIYEDKAILTAWNGHIGSHWDKQSESKKSPIDGVDAQDVLEVSFDPRSSTVTFRNEKSEQTATITIKEKITHPLYYCVMLYSSFDKVELIQ